MHQDIVELCRLSDTVCKLMGKHGFLLPEVDNMSREEVMAANFPSGSGYRNTVYYGQCVDNGGNFRKFDYGKDANYAIYGQITPPDIPVENINVPVAIFVGDRDPLVTPSDIDYLIEQLGDNAIHRQTIPGDHWTFSMSSDMSWFSGDLVHILKGYNPAQ